MKIVEMPVSKLKPYKRNNRKHPQTQIDKLAKQIAAHGWDVPIVVDKDFVIIKGHGRARAAKQLGLKQVPVVVRDDLTPEQCNAARIADNKLSELAEIDMEALQLELDALKAINFDLDLTAFDSWNPFAVESEQPTEGLTDPDDVPELKPDPKSKLGDVWLLGNHRVMCGDSTDAASVAILMDGHKAEMLFTDPPYGVDYHSQNATMYYGNGKKGKERERIEGDKDTGLYPKIVKVLPDIVDGPSYVFCGAGKEIDLLTAIEENSLTLINTLVWDKMRFGGQAIGANYKPCFEIFCYIIDKKSKRRWAGPDNEQTIWKLKRDNKTDLHPTQKPVELAERAIKNHEAKTVLDLFLGSGSTLIACEKTGRKCYGMELSPQYVDVIIKRWQDFTGKKAVREDGTEFDAL